MQRNRASFSNRYTKWWLGTERADIHVFLAEEFGEVQRGLGLIMGIGAVLFAVRGILEMWANMGPGWSQELAFRIGGAMLFGSLWFAYDRTHSSQVRTVIFCLYLFAYIGMTAWWAPQHGLHIGYLAVPIVLCIAFGVLMWPRIGGLYWPVGAVVIPAIGMLINTQATARDWSAYMFYFLVAIVFAFAVRRTRLRTAFALFVFRENLRNRAERDPLTGLLNRAGWNEQAGAVFKVAQESNMPASVVFFDIDFFKKVNDEHGHATGDRVLIHVAHIIERTLRPGDVVGRLGGEEFVAVLLGVGAEEAMEISNKVRREIRDSRGPVPVSISAGVAQMDPRHTLSETMHQADLGLLEAKRMGRNRVVMLPAGSAVPA